MADLAGEAANWTKAFLHILLAGSRDVDSLRPWLLLLLSRRLI